MIVNFKTAIDNRIGEIMKNFDFVKVHKTMHQLNWCWSGKGIPTVDHLKDTAERLLQSIVVSKDRYISTGGFVVTYYECRSTNPPWFDLNLMFVLEDAGDDGVEFQENGHKKHVIKI